MSKVIVSRATNGDPSHLTVHGMSAPRARDLAARILRFWLFDEVRDADREVSMFAVTGKNEETRALYRSLYPKG
jgi:hypothetical protein